MKNIGIKLLKIAASLLHLVAVSLFSWILNPFGELMENNNDGKVNCSPNYSIEVDILDLPDHLLSLIADKLSLQKDLIRFGAVCRSWQSVYSDIMHRRSPRLPLLMLGTEFNHDTQTRSFYSLTDKRVCNSQVPVPHNRYCPGSSHGWLVTVCEEPDFPVRLLNPFLSVDNEINLPSLTAFEFYLNGGTACYVGYLHKAVLSANPASQPNYVVMAIYSACSFLAFYRPGDNAWTSLDRKFAGIVDVIYCRDQFYAIDQNGEAFSVDFNHSPPRVSKIAPRPPPPKFASKRYLVESSGDLLQVLRYTYFEEPEDDVCTNYFNDGFDVFKLDPSEHKWIELDNLDGCLLFLGDNSSLCLRASDFPECKPNSIYFTDDYYEGYCLSELPGIGPHDIGVFSFEDCTVEPHYPTESNMIYPAPIWIEPPP